MKSKVSNTNKLSLSSSITQLAANPKRPTKTIEKLLENGITTINDLLWITPLHIQKTPQIEPFDKIKVDSLFKGIAKVVNINAYPAYGRKGKGRVQLFNMQVTVQDLKSPNSLLTLRWFNAYPGIKKKIDTIGEFIFLGKVEDYKGTLQIINPKIIDESIANKEESPYLIEYPTINSVTSTNLKKLITKIPASLIENIKDELPNDIIAKRSLYNLKDCFKLIHGKIDVENFELDYNKACNRLIYEEFFHDQLKILTRKKIIKGISSPRLLTNSKLLAKYISLFPYQLTDDQNKVIDQIINDYTLGYPMMRLVQGDVGCGKTTVAIIAALIAIDNKKQVAFMCPTETLAIQHFETLKKILPKEINFKLLLGSTTAKEKKKIYQDLAIGEISLIVGTHSLFQDAVVFKDLALAIVDEQHKFGVEQRTKLMNKGKGCHTIIMTATPIPRTLQLAQYGDLNISTIRSVPSGRKGTQTRIVKQGTFDQYLSFLKTRISLNEQAYIVVPAIEESETMNINNVNSLIEKYRKYFPEYNIQPLHGQLKPSEKENILKEFVSGKIKALISTTVIEVGINVLNATVMSIYNPERFGLSSLHQLRGRVGRGDKPGFCFLITDNNISAEALQRLKVIENNTDGFVIADADLKNRGEGDLFGANQSGTTSSHKLANLFKHTELFENAYEDISEIYAQDPLILKPYFDIYLNDSIISSTI